MRYYITRLNKICAQFLGLITVSSVTAEALYEAIKSFFEVSGIKYKQCFALRTDGAANLSGHRHSIYTLLGQVIPDLLLIKCLCHSLHLVCCNANKEMLSCLEYRLRQTFDWFHRSTLIKTKDLYQTIHDGKGSLPLLSLLGTRWLAHGNSVATESFSNGRRLKLIFKKLPMYVTNM